MFSVLPFLLFLSYVSAAVVAESPPAYNPPDLFFFNCGASSSKQPDDDGRTWESDDKFPKFMPAKAADISLVSKPEEQGSNVPQVPYTTGVRIFQSNFTYSFPLSAGPKFIRLYFFPSQFNAKGLTFNKTESYFSVTANEHTLLRNFSAYLTAAVTNYPFVNKEYIVNVDESQMLNITFAPSPNSYAFVNGIEIVSIPTGYYIRGDPAGANDNQIKWVPDNNNNYYYIYNNTAFETLYRLIAGGQTLLAANDTGMYRKWYSDDEYVIGYGYFTPHLDVDIAYTELTPNYSAPKIVYTTSRTIANYSSAVNWTFAVDSGFLYLFRLYFCEFAIEIDGGNERVFSVEIANETAESHADVFLMAGGSKIPIFKDYLVNVRDNDGRRGKQNVSLAIRPNMATRPVWANALLNGLEIFKLNDTQGSLAAANPDFISQPVQSPPREKKKGGATVGAVVGGVCGGILVIAILGFLIFRQRRRRVANSAGSITKTTWDPLSVVPPSTHNTDGSGAPLPSDLCRSFSLEDLKSATGNFNEKFVVGKGGFGKVYRGFIDNGAIAVAIKRLNPESSQGIREFQTEIEMLSRLRHLHLVSLIGYCNDNGEMILVYDYMAKGTLRDHLYKSDNNPSLPWKKRLEISIGAAKGLHYLHTGAKWTIIHRDVKSTNILLDERWVAKVSDFGLSKVGPLGEAYTHVSTAVKGSVGYVDPEYYRRQQVTEKSDVYSFGVVLFEVLCARPAVIPTQTREKVNLAEWARQCCRKGTVDQMVDPRLRGEIAPESLNKYAEIACNCLKEQGIDRPAMSDVVWSLEFALQLQEAAEKRSQAAGVDGFPPGSPSFPLLGNGDSSTTTDNSEGVFSTSDEVAAMSTTSGSGTATTTTGIDRLQSHNVFSLLNHPEGR